MKLEPYTVPEQDADLWGCGVVLDPSPDEAAVEEIAAGCRPTEARIVRLMSDGPISTAAAAKFCALPFAVARDSLRALQRAGVVTAIHWGDGRRSWWLRLLMALPAKERAASQRRLTLGEASNLVLEALAKCESATLLEIAATTRQSRYVTGGAIMKLAAVGAIRAVGTVALRSNNGVNAESRWTVVGREESSAASAAWAAWLKKARAEERAYAEECKKREEEERQQDARACAERARINGWNAGARTLPNGTRIVGSVLPTDPKPR